MKWKHRITICSLATQTHDNTMRWKQLTHIQSRSIFFSRNNFKTYHKTVENFLGMLCLLTRTQHKLMHHLAWQFPIEDHIVNERRQYYGHVGVIERGADFRGGVFIQFLQRNKPSHLIGVQSYPFFVSLMRKCLSPKSGRLFKQKKE